MHIDMTAFAILSKKIVSKHYWRHLMVKNKQTDFLANPINGHLFSMFLHDKRREREREGKRETFGISPSSYKAPGPIRLKSHSVTSFNLYHLLTDPVSSNNHIGG